jgi:hypothetical protein
MSTSIITKTKVSIGAVEPSELTIAFDVGIPGGTSARAEFAPDTGFIEPKLMTLQTDPEVQAEVYVLLDGSEKRLLSLDENSSVDVDVDEAYGDLSARKLILIGKTKTATTAIRRVSLKYSGEIFDYR